MPPSSPPAEATRTPPVFKWLLNERAMLMGKIARAETELARLQGKLGALHGKVPALAACRT